MVQAVFDPLSYQTINLAVCWLYRQPLRGERRTATFSVEHFQKRSQRNISVLIQWKDRTNTDTEHPLVQNTSCTDKYHIKLFGMFTTLTCQIKNFPCQNYFFYNYSFQMQNNACIGSWTRKNDKQIDSESVLNLFSIQIKYCAIDWNEIP